MAVKPNDVLCRRIPIAFLDQKAAEGLLPEVVDILAKERDWTPEQKENELKEAVSLIEFMK